MAEINKINVGGTEYDIAPITEYTNWITDLTNDGRFLVGEDGTVSVEINSNESNKYISMVAADFSSDFSIYITDGTKNCKIFIDLSDFQDIQGFSITNEKSVSLIKCGYNSETINEYIDGVELGWGTNGCVYLITNEQSGSFGTILIEIDEFSNAKVYVQKSEGV